MSLEAGFYFGHSLIGGGYLELFEHEMERVEYQLSPTLIKASSDINFIVLRGRKEAIIQSYPTLFHTAGIMIMSKFTSYPTNIPTVVKWAIDAAFDFRLPSISVGAHLYGKPSIDKYFAVGFADIYILLVTTSGVFVGIERDNGNFRTFAGKNYYDLPAESQQFIPHPGQNIIQYQNLYAKSNVMYPNISRNIVFKSYFLDDSIKHVFIETTSSTGSYADIEIYTPKGDIITKNNYV